MTDSKNSDNREASDSTADDSVASETVESLGTTVGTFANRIRRKLREQEILDDVSQKEKELRHARLLQAMTTIRKALQETCKIKLGKRFYMNLDVDDWEGWPRLELKLVDLKAPERVDYSLIVTANDRKSQGNVRIHLLSGKQLGHLILANVEEVQRIPLVLKKSVRKYLDIVADYVLNPKKPSELIEEQTKALEEVKPEEDVHSSELKKENLFSEDIIQTKNTVATIDDDTVLNQISLDEKEGEDSQIVDDPELEDHGKNTVDKLSSNEPLEISSFEKK